MSETMDLIGGLDVGNGYIKASIAGRDRDGQRRVDHIDLPSGVAVTLPRVDLPWEMSEVVDMMEKDVTSLDGFYNQLDASFESDIIDNREYHRMFGSRGIASGSNYREFDISSKASKVDQELSRVFVLGLFAAKALRDTVLNTGALPSDGVINVRCVAALALPIGEYVANKGRYEGLFIDHDHTVHLHGFDRPVTVYLNFERVIVLAEGASAQYAIVDAGEKLVDVMLRDARQFGIVGLDDITAEDICSAHNSVGIDIGEGTVNFPVYVNKQFNRELSRTLDQGYGTVLENAMVEMSKDAPFITTRKQLADMLLSIPSRIQRSRWETVKGYVDGQARLFAEQVCDEFTTLLQQASATEVVFVYGGGAEGLREPLHRMLLETSKRIFGVDGGAPVLYLSSVYSRNLNRKGLFLLAQHVAGHDVGMKVD